jgi:hypothetical protein
MMMAPWVWPALVFAAVLTAAALLRRRRGLAAGFLLYGVAAVLLSGATAAPLRFISPLVVLVAGYWLTAPFYVGHSLRLEAWLRRYDERWHVDALAARAPRWIQALMEMAYAGCYAFMVAAAIPAFRHSSEALAWHWTLVLSAELACYVTLPWLQARPPRDVRASARLVPGSEPEDREKSTGMNSALRRLNESILDKLSVHATTIPSGHVAGPIAASLSAWMIAPDSGPWLLAGALIITAATVIGRYHYAIDAVLGLAVGIVPPAVRSLLS